MPEPAPILLLTRPEASSRRFAAAVQVRLGTALRPLISPLIEIVFDDRPLDLGDVAGLVFTSENGVAAYFRLKQSRNLPAWCVGDRTAEAARAGGLAARSAAGDVQALARVLARERPAGPLLHLHGAQKAGDLAGTLAAEGIELRSLEAYRQEARPATAEAQAAMRGQTPVIAPVFSPRSARLFRENFPEPRAPLSLIALSPAVAEALGARPGETLATAARPDAEAMIAALANRIAAGPAA
jgi:uroporphyrinogen-III synthase